MQIRRGRRIFYLVCAVFFLFSVILLAYDLAASRQHTVEIVVPVPLAATPQAADASR